MEFLPFKRETSIWWKETGTDIRGTKLRFARCSILNYQWCPDLTTVQEMQAPSLSCAQGSQTSRETSNSKVSSQRNTDIKIAFASLFCPSAAEWQWESGLYTFRLVKRRAKLQRPKPTHHQWFVGMNSCMLIFWVLHSIIWGILGKSWSLWHQSQNSLISRGQTEYLYWRQIPHSYEVPYSRLCFQNDEN